METKQRIKYRKKVFIIPYSGCKVMCVKDRITKEWGFLSGGVKERKYESYLHAAERELCEETSNILKYIPRNHKTFKFLTDYIPTTSLRKNIERDEIIISKYMVYMFDLNEYSDNIINDLHTKFRPNSEIEEVKVAPYSSFENRWVVCDEFWEYYNKYYRLTTFR